jgi:hypothetical protein
MYCNLRFMAFNLPPALKLKLVIEVSGDVFLPAMANNH